MPQEASLLSIQDRLAIHSLYGRYCICFDLGDVEGWLACWSENGIFKGAKEVQGREPLRVYMEESVARRADAPNKHAQHWNNNIIFEGDERSARGMCYLLTVARNKETQGVVILQQGVYVDELAKVDGEWCFARRRLTQDLPPSQDIPRAV